VTERPTTTYWRGIPQALKGSGWQALHACRMGHAVSDKLKALLQCGASHYQMPRPFALRAAAAAVQPTPSAEPAEMATTTCNAHIIMRHSNTYTQASCHVHDGLRSILSHQCCAAQHMLQKVHTSCSSLHVPGKAGHLAWCQLNHNEWSATTTGMTATQRINARATTLTKMAIIAVLH
jgi:hypothetical protein